MISRQAALPAIIALLVCSVLLPGPRTVSAAPFVGVASVSVRSIHSCALTTAGGLKCWGANGEGELGDGTTISKSTPVDVTGLTSGVVMVSAGEYNSCAVTAAGGVKCWGWDGMNGGTHTPVDVPGLTSGVAAVSAGRSHSCALTTSSGVRCWGSNLYGQLGDGTTTGSATPVDVTGLTSGVAAVSAGGLYTCAVTTTGGVKCWGLNVDGELGDGGACGKVCTTPVDVTGLASGVAAVSLSTGEFYVSCAVTTAGGAKCWGSDQYGALGIGSSTSPDTCEVGFFATPCSTTPVDVAGLTTGVSSVSVGAAFACALTTAGGVNCWGSNFWGQLGEGTRWEQDTPVDVTGLTGGVAAVSVGYGHSCALTAEGGLKCWGDDEFGQLGDGTTRRSDMPVDVVETSPYPVGDVNCDGAVSSIDALLVLQLGARLLPPWPLECSQNEDVNRDGDVNAIDAAVILQYGAGLIRALPV